MGVGAVQEAVEEVDNLQAERGEGGREGGHRLRQSARGGMRAGRWL